MVRPLWLRGECGWRIHAVVCTHIPDSDERRRFAPRSVRWNTQQCTLTNDDTYSTMFTVQPPNLYTFRFGVKKSHSMVTSLTLYNSSSSVGDGSAKGGLDLGGEWCVQRPERGCLAPRLGSLSYRLRYENHTCVGSECPQAQPRRQGGQHKPMRPCWPMAHADPRVLDQLSTNRNSELAGIPPVDPPTRPSPSRIHHARRALTAKPA